MADPKILSTAEFLSTMKKTPLGADTSLTFGDAQALAQGGIDTTKYDFSADNDYASMLQEEKESDAWWDKVIGTLDTWANQFGRVFTGMFEGLVDYLVINPLGAVSGFFGGVYDVTQGGDFQTGFEGASKWA